MFKNGLWKERKSGPCNYRGPGERGERKGGGGCLFNPGVAKNLEDGKKRKEEKGVKRPRPGAGIGKEKGII